MTPRILGIIVNWNKRELLETMLSSLQASGLPENFDTVLVDNASTDGSVEMVREKFPWVNLLLLPENVGGTGGFNAGMRYGLEHPNDYKYFWLLDNDIIVHPGAGQGLLNVLESDPRVGMAGSAILLMRDPEHVQECGTVINWKRGSIERVLEGPLRELPQNAVVPCDYVAACSLMARVEAIRQVGIWDPAYFVFWDDMEWGVRFNRAGWKVVATTGSQVQHESYRDRRGRSAAFGAYQDFRNLLYFLWRNAPGRYRMPAFFRQLRLALSISDHFRISGQDMEVRALQYGIQDFFSGWMGPPRPEVQSRRPTPLDLRGTPLDPGSSWHPRRVVLLIKDNPIVARSLYEQLQAEYPEALIDTVLLDPKPEMLREQLPRRVTANIGSIWGRLRLVCTLPMHYNAVVAPAFQQPFFFEKVVALSMRYSDGALTGVTRRDMVTLLRLILMRMRSLAMAAVLTIRALLKPRTPVDYFGFRR